MDARPRSFYVLSAFFILFLLFLYGPTLTIGILSFQGPKGGLTFPMNGVSMHWFADLFKQQAVGDIWGSFRRSFVLGLMVMASTVFVSVSAGLAFRKNFKGSGVLCYMAIAATKAPPHGRPSALSFCRSSRPHSLAWLCLALPYPTMNSPARF